MIYDMMYDSQWKTANQAARLI